MRGGKTEDVGSYPARGERLDILEALSDAENARLWVDEAERRGRAWDANGHAGRAASEVLRDVRARLGMIDSPLITGRPARAAPAR